MNHNFYFNNLNNPTRYHLANLLYQHGYNYNSNNKDTCFNEENIKLDDKCNHLEYKHLLTNLLQQYNVQFLPESYNIDDGNWVSILEFITDKYYLINNTLIEKIPNLLWILKPSMTNNGEYILLFDNIAKLWDHFVIGNRLGGSHVLQRYIDSPNLHQGKKYTLRFYVIITNYCGVYLYPHGYLNISNEIYDINQPNNLSIHLTNEHLGGNLLNVIQKSTKKYLHYNKIMPNIIAAIKKTIALADKNHPEIRIKKKQRAFDIFGFDFIIDKNLKPWLLEINHAPHFPTTLPHTLNEVLFNQFWQDLGNAFLMPIAKKEKYSKPNSLIWIEIADKINLSFWQKIKIFLGIFP